MRASILSVLTHLAAPRRVPPSGYATLRFVCLAPLGSPRLGDDARLEGIGQRDVLVRHRPFQHFKEPVPVHRRLEAHARIGPALHQRGELSG